MNTMGEEEEEEEGDNQDLYDFEPLPTLLEDEENVSLADILSLRDSSLSEQEIWAVCLECIYSLKSISHSAIFQTLCITPDTLAFNNNGNVCFRELLSDDPEGAFVPPEFDITGNTYEAHIYSLGATLKATSEFGIEPELEPNFCKELKYLFEQMQQENPLDRPDIEIIISLCEEKMKCSSSCNICCNLSAVGRRVLSIESINAFQDECENTWRGRKYQADTEVKPQRDEKTAESIPFAAENCASKLCLNGCLNSLTLEDGKCKYGLNEIAIKTDNERTPLLSKFTNHYNEEKIVLFHENHNDSVLETGQCDHDFGRLLRKSLTSKPQSFPKNPVKYTEESYSLTTVSGSDNGELTKKSWPSASDLPFLDSSKDDNFCNICLQTKSQPKLCQVFSPNSQIIDSHECAQLSNIFRGKVPSVPKGKPEFCSGCGTDEFCLASPETPLVQVIGKVADHLPPGTEVLRKDCTSPGDCAQTSILLKGDNLSQINCKFSLLNTDTSGKDCKAHQNNSSQLSRSSDKQRFDGTRESELINDNEQWISLKDLLSWYGRPLKEYELWALCHECLNALQTCINYPVYLNLDAVMIDSSGEVLFSVSEDAEYCDSFCLAPEFEERGLVTEKVCVYGVAAILWTAAKYNSSPDHKLSLPKKLKRLLLNMAKKNANDRPSVAEALQICKKYLSRQGIKSKEIWSQLSRCAYQQNEDAALPDCVSLELSDKHNKEGSLESIVGFVPVTNKKRIIAVKGPVPCQSSLNNEVSTLPTTFTSPATYFKPIILMQNTDIRRNKHEDSKMSSSEQFGEVVNNEIQVKNNESISVTDIENHAVKEHSEAAHLPPPQKEKQTASSMSNSFISSLKGQTPNNVLSFTACSASISNPLSDQKEIISTASSSSSSVCSTLLNTPLPHNFLLKQDPKREVQKLPKQVLSLHFHTENACEWLCNPPEVLSCSLHNNACDISYKNNSYSNQTTARQEKSIKNIIVLQNDSSCDATNNSSKMNRKAAEVTKEKLGIAMSFPEDSSSMDANIKCSSDLEPASQQKRTICSSVQKVVQLIQEEFAFDGYLENGVEDLAMGEYIFALKGLQFGTFCGAVSEKFCDLYWDEPLLENLYTVVNGETLSPVGISKDISTLINTSENLKRNNTSARKKTRKPKKIEKQSNCTQLNLVQHEDSVCITFPLPVVSFQTDGSPKSFNLNPGQKTQMTSDTEITPTIDSRFEEMDLQKLLSDSCEKECRPQHPPLRTETKEHSDKWTLLQAEGFCLGPDFTAVIEEHTEDMFYSMADIYRCNPGWRSAFYGAQCFHPDVQSYINKLGIQKENETANIRAKKLELQQQLMIETKNYRKTVKFYQKLMQKERRNKVTEVRSTMVKLKGQLEEMKSKVLFLELVKKCLQVTDAEQWGLDQCALPIVINMSTRCEMEYNHFEEKSLLTFCNVREHKGDKHTKSKILQAGTPLGLMAYLYTRTAILEGYVQQFLYTFRYFCTQQGFLQFLIERAKRALSSENLDSSSTFAKIYNRTLYLLQAWIEDCCTVDFTANPDLLDIVEKFIYSTQIPKDNHGEQLLSLLQDIASRKHEFTSCLSFVQQKDDEDTKSLHSLCTKLSEDNISRKSFNWIHFNENDSLLPHQKKKKYTIASALSRPCYPKFIEGFSRSYVKVYERDSYFINEYSVLQLSNQLTLLQEKMFQKCHPVHFLNSRSLGVKDRATTATKTVRSEALPAEVYSLFVQDCIQDNYLIQILRYEDNVSKWVAAEIVTSHTSKLQANLLAKFLLIAKCCYKQRNFATAIQILKGLENLIVRQLPVWKNIPSKVSEILKELKAVEVFLKSDSLCLMKGDKFKTLPTIPSAHLLAMHIQQLETGGFTMVNGTFKWTKLRNIAKVVSQVHAFQELPYSLTPDPELQYYLKKRFAHFSEADISALAAENNTNFYQITAEKHSRRIQDTLRRMKATFQ
ncbi:kinase non-catalytic C-lobe domain-containing protein 1 [Microcaecilia unicolor]|uniref:Kinase non-catalytic C-lobe domain-containing protein 1 n=1 Tax=Microcaecilia unicolor TaxID=1415580 RepID=A0A6P7Y176_9AMPH|nr:kinase non-catalytic C-lobe domain-containing protein 1 [Microcaecilia unicolor]